MSRTLTLDPADFPNGSKIFVGNDWHIPHVDKPFAEAVINMAEDIGVTHTIALGDMADCGVSSRHPNKRARDTIELGSLAASVDRGRWIFDWFRTRPCWYLLGNHERWVETAIATDANLVDTTDPMTLMGLPKDGEGWTVLPSNGRLRLGSFVWEHGHGIFPSGSGGQNPAVRIKTAAPDQTTMVGHLHRKFALWWSNQDEDGVQRTHAAFGNGHGSLTESHSDYAGSYPNWQQSVAVITVWYEGARPRFTVDQPEVFRDRKNRPVFEFRGKVYK